MDDDLYNNAQQDGEEEKVCKVYDGEDFFTVFVQLLLCAIALGSLWLKRMREVPRRKFMTWFLDVSKQALGACYAHFLNMGIANIIASNVRGQETLQDECAWYAINYLLDTSLGLFLSIIFLKTLENIAEKLGWESLKDSGVYTGENACRHWIHQMMAWLLILSLVKVVLLTVMYFSSGLLAIFASWLFKPLESNIRFELLFVMIFFPGVLNIVWFWITDSYLKAKDHHGDAHETSTDAEVSGMDSKKSALIYQAEEENMMDGQVSGVRDAYVSPILSPDKVRTGAMA